MKRSLINCHRVNYRCWDDIYVELASVAHRTDLELNDVINYLLKGILFDDAFLQILGIEKEKNQP